MRKLLDKGFPPFVVRWIRAFLSDRKGKVRVGDMVSALKAFLEGFPQGTVLGPIFWDLFVDDIVEAVREGLPPGVSCEVVLYADDVTVVLRGKELAPMYANAQHVLDNLSRWEVENEALVSLEKTTVTVFVPDALCLPEEKRPQLTYPDQAAAPPLRSGTRSLRSAACG